MIQALRESYTYTSQSVKATSQAIRPVRTQTQVKLGSDKTRICKNYNMGACVKGASHVSSGILHSHYCNFCHQNGPKFCDTEKGQEKT